MKLKLKIYRNKKTDQASILLPKKLFKKIPKKIDVFIPKRYLKGGKRK